MSVIQTIHLSVLEDSIPQTIPAVQNDTDRSVKMIIDDLTLTSGMTGTLNFKRSDGSHYGYTATLDTSDNSFTATLDQALTQPGRTYCQLKVTDSDVVSTFTFIVNVTKDVSGTVTEQEGIDLTQAIQAAEDAQEAAEDAADRAESAATDAEEQAALVDAEEIWSAITALDNLFLQTVDVTSELVDGYYITNQSTGSTVPTTLKSSSTDKCGIFPCQKGDVFTITGKGGQTDRTWAFTDTNYLMLSKSAGSAMCTNLKLTATEDGYFFFNSESNQNPSVKISKLQIPVDTTLTQNGVPANAKTVGDILNIKVITNPYDFAWFYGGLSSTNHYTYTDDGLVNYDPIHVQAGSSVSVATNGGIKFNAYLIYDDGTTEYKSYNANPLSISKSGLLRIGVGKSNGADTNNMAILNGLVLSLIVDKNDVPTSPFLRDAVMMGTLPVNNYIGRHTDITGFNQTSEYDTVIQKWRDLPTLASGYISETDYGEIYSGGPHQYGYKLIPPNRGLLNKKLPHVFIVTSLHGNEKSATYGLLYLIEDMLNHSMEDPVLFYLRNFVRFTIMPMANPYGWNANSSLGTHAGIRQNENGVNLNRNFGVSTWSDYDGEAEYNTPGEYNYRGTGEFSEVETQNIKNALIDTHSDISLIVDIHTYGTDTTSLVSITFAGVNNDTDQTMSKMPVAINQYLSEIKNHMDELYSVNLGLDKVYGSATIDSSVNMTMQDYGYDAFRLPSLTLEVLCGSTNGYLGSALSKYSADTIKLCGEMIGNFLIKALHYIAV